MTSTETVAPAKGPRWLSPATLGGTMLLYIIGYPIVQSLTLLLLCWLNGERVPFVTTTQWAVFVATAAGVGVVAGVAVYHVQRMRAGWRRDWADYTVRMVALAMMLSSHQFSLTSATWWISLVVTAVTMGMVWTGFAAMSRDDPPPPAPELPAHASDLRA